MLESVPTPDALDWLHAFSQHLKRANSIDILRDTPDNAYNLEKGNILISKVDNDGFIPFRRYFYEPPTVSVFLTFRFTDDENDKGQTLSPSTKPRSYDDNNNNNESPLSPLSPVSPRYAQAFLSPLSPQTSQRPKSPNNRAALMQIEDQETYCYRFMPLAYTITSQGFTINQKDSFAIDTTAEIFYIAFNRLKPVNQSLKSLMSKLSVGGPDMLQIVREWVDAGNYISSTSSDEQTLLHVACQYNHEAVAKWLVERGIEKEIRDKNGWTPILCAINGGNIGLVDYLIKKGAMKLPVFTTNGSSYFHYLVRLIPSSPAETEIYIKILEETCKIYQLQTMHPNYALEIPLHRAASAGNVVACSWLLDTNRPFNYDPNTETRFGDTPLHHAVKSGNPKVVSYLINHLRIDVPPRFPPNSPYNLAMKGKLPEIANLFPIEAKVRLYNMTAYLLQHIVDFLDAKGIARCSAINHRFRNLAKATLARKYKGRSASKIGLWEEIEQANHFLQKDLNISSSPQFVADWNANRIPNNTHDYLIKIVTLGSRGVGATTLMRSGLSNYAINTDFTIKNFEHDGVFTRLQIWEKTQGRGYGRFYDVPSSYMRGCTLALCLYDSSNPEEYEVVQNWITFLDRYTYNTLVLFVGTKADISSPKRITTDQMAEHIKSRNLPGMYFESDPANADFCHYPYVIECRQDDLNSIRRMFCLVAHMAIRFKKHLVAKQDGPARVNPPAPAAKKSIVASLKSLFK